MPSEHPSQDLPRGSRGSGFASLTTYAWAMVAAFSLLLFAGVVGLVLSSWEWEFLHLVVAASFAYAALDEGGDGVLRRAFVGGTSAVLVLTGGMLCAAALFWGASGLLLAVFYVVCGGVGLLAAGSS